MRAFPKPLAVVALAALAGTACGPQPPIKESRIPDTQMDYTIIGGEVRYARRGG